MLLQGKSLTTALINLKYDASVPFKYDRKAFLFLVVASSKIYFIFILLLATTKNRNALR